jgi:hypothetical protein
MTSVKFVANKGKVLLWASSMWATYGAIVLFLADRFVEYLRSPAANNLSWRDAVLGILLIAIPPLRVLRQDVLHEPEGSSEPTTILQGDFDDQK